MRRIPDKNSAFSESFSGRINEFSPIEFQRKEIRLQYGGSPGDMSAKWWFPVDAIEDVDLVTRFVNQAQKILNFNKCRVVQDDCLGVIRYRQGDVNGEISYSISETSFKSGSERPVVVLEMKWKESPN